VTQMNFVNLYGRKGFTSWEFPQLNSGLPAVNDSDGESFPFYGHSMEICQLVGPIHKETKVEVKMADSPCSRITLKSPSRHTSEKLTKISRNQKFNSWLVAFNDVNGECVELMAFEWEVIVNVEIKNDWPILLEPKVQLQPRIMKEVTRVPQCAKMAPDANCAQMLVYRPLINQDPELISIVVAPTYRGLYQLTMKELENELVYETARNCLKKIHPLSITSRRNQSQPR